VVETRGAAHNQEFEVECSIPKLEVNVRGTGRSRRAAEQSAAKRALETAQQAIAQLGRRPRRKAAPAEPPAVAAPTPTPDGAAQTADHT
jgi:ribonuclease-3